MGAYMEAAYSLSRIGVHKEQVTSEYVTIYIVSIGVHADLVLPLKTTEVDWIKYIMLKILGQKTDWLDG